MIPTTKDLFDLIQTEHAILFDGVQQPWEVIPKIAVYIKQHGKSIGEGTTIAPTASIADNVIIGKNCDIRPGAYIRENSIIGDNCVIGNSTEIKNSLIFNNVQLPHFNYVGDSILGYKAHLGGGAGLSNYKSDGSEIIIKTDDQSYPTGLRKFGGLIGDNVEIGAKALLNPGTIVGRNSLIYPLALVRGIVPANHIVKVRQQQEVLEKR